MNLYNPTRYIYCDTYIPLVVLQEGRCIGEFWPETGKQQTSRQTKHWAKALPALQEGRMTEKDVWLYVGSFASILETQQPPELHVLIINYLGH